MGAYYFWSLVKWQTERVGTWEHLQFPSSSIIKKHFFSQNFYLFAMDFFEVVGSKASNFVGTNPIFISKRNTLKQKHSPVVQRTETFLYLVNIAPFCEVSSVCPPKKSTKKPTKQRTSTTSLLFFVCFSDLLGFLHGTCRTKNLPKKISPPVVLPAKNRESGPGASLQFCLAVVLGPHLRFRFGCLRHDESHEGGAGDDMP